MPRASLLFAATLIFGLSGCQQEDAPPPEPADVEALAVAEPQCELTLGWDPWEPYHFMGTGGNVIGLDIDLVGTMAEQIGCELVLRQDSWINLLRMLREGDLDLLVGATQNPEREEFAYFSAPYRSESFGFYVRPDEAARYESSSLEALLEEGFRIGVTQGYIYSEDISRLHLDERFENLFVEAPIGEINFTNLLDHHIDGFVEDIFVCAAIARRRGWQDHIQPLPLEMQTGEVHIMFSRHTVDESLVARFDEALEEMRASGQYDEIRERYLY